MKCSTLGFKNSESPSAHPKPGLELNDTGKKSKSGPSGEEVLVERRLHQPVHVAAGRKEETVTYGAESKAGHRPDRGHEEVPRHGFPGKNGKRIPKAFVVIDGEP